MTEEKNNRMEFFGGLTGAVAPVVLAFGGIIFMAVSGRDGYYGVLIFGFLSLVLGLILAKDKRSYGDTLISSLQKSMICTVAVAFMFAGMLSALLRASGLIQALIWLIGTMNIPAGILPAATFIVCVIVSTSCGTSTGTCTAVGGVMLPLADELGVSLTLMTAAVISGAIFGDNLAPISDTTIASSQTQGMPVAEVVRTRLPYSLIAGTISFVLYVVIGLRSQGGSGAIEGDPTTAKSLIFLVLPVMLIVLMRKGWGLGSSLLLSNGICIVLGILIGTLDLDLMFSGDSPIIKGMTGMGTTIIISFLMIMMVGIPLEAGVFSAIADYMQKKSGGIRQTELAVFCMCLLCATFIGGSTTAIIFLGPLAKNLMDGYGELADPCRTANILDGTCCGITGFLPHGNPMLVTTGIALSLPTCDPNLSFLTVAPYNFHCMFLLILFLGSILTGIGRKRARKASQTV